LVVPPDSIAFAASPGARSLSRNVSTVTAKRSRADVTSQRIVARIISAPSPCHEARCRFPSRRVGGGPFAAPPEMALERGLPLVDRRERRLGRDGRSGDLLCRVVREAGRHDRYEPCLVYQPRLDLSIRVRLRGTGCFGLLVV